MPKKKGEIERVRRHLRTHLNERGRELPNNTVFWTTIAVVGIFIIVLSVVLITRYTVTGRIVQYWDEPTRPFASDPRACRNVPACGGTQSYMCCALGYVPGFGDQRCTAPLYKYKSESPRCPEQMPFACPCPEKYQYRQSWPIPFS